MDTELDKLFRMLYSSPFRPENLDRAYQEYQELKVDQRILLVTLERLGMEASPTKEALKKAGIVTS